LTDDYLCHMQDMILILDFGSQYTQLIARRVRELNVYCEIKPFNYVPDNWDNIKGVIMSGSPFCVRDPNAPEMDIDKYRGKVPVMGLCYGAQYIAKTEGGVVEASPTREYGRANLSWLDNESKLFKGISHNTQVWMSHGDHILRLPGSSLRLASTYDIENAAFVIEKDKLYGLQFHPEVYHTKEGGILLKNFIVDICGCKQEWTPEQFVETTIEQLQKKIGNEKVVLGLSGGVDSSVAGVLLHKAIGSQLYCIFVDNGLLRKNEFEEVLASYKDMGLNVRGIRAAERFYMALKGKADPEEKRKAIGHTFIEIFDEAAQQIREVNWLAQGTIYPDVIESVSVNGPSVTIKSHHNVGGLPEKMNLKIVEPLNSLFKDEVRRLGKTLDIPSDILQRHPFPGPGLAIRVLGEVTAERIAILQEVDNIYIEALKKYDFYNKVWQAAAILLPVNSVGVMGDERTYENVVCLRAVSSTDGMTADWSKLPYDFLAKVSNQIINKVKGVNRVVYDISSKPPATIEWE